MIYPLLVASPEQAVIMSKNDVLKAIREAESEATKILETANKEAASIVSTARSDASEIVAKGRTKAEAEAQACLLYTSPSPRDQVVSRMPSSA